MYLLTTAAGFIAGQGDISQLTAVHDDIDASI